MIAFLVNCTMGLVVLMMVSVGLTAVVFGVMMMLDKEWVIVDKMLSISSILAGLTLINLIAIAIFG